MSYVRISVQSFLAAVQKQSGLKIKTQDSWHMQYSNKFLIIRCF